VIYFLIFSYYYLLLDFHDHVQFEQLLYISKIECFFFQRKIVQNFTHSFSSSHVFSKNKHKTKEFYSFKFLSRHLPRNFFICPVDDHYIDLTDIVFGKEF
jgi:hypothetical protein